MRFFSSLLLLIMLAVSLMACGRKGRLYYPDMLQPAPPVVTSAMQSGSSIKLQFSIPDKDLSGHSYRGITGVNISRKSVNSGKENSCRLCSSGYLPLQTIYLENLPPNCNRFGNMLFIVDSSVLPESSYSYSVAAFSKEHLENKGVVTEFIPVSATISAPILKVDSAPTEIKLEFEPPQTAGVPIGYNIYRSTESAAKSLQPINRLPIKEPFYVDKLLERNVKYRYTVKILIEKGDKIIVESPESNEVTGMLKDDE